MLHYTCITHHRHLSRHHPNPAALHPHASNTALHLLLADGESGDAGSTRHVAAGGTATDLLHTVLEVTQAEVSALSLYCLVLVLLLMSMYCGCCCPHSSCSTAQSGVLMWHHSILCLACFTTPGTRTFISTPTFSRPAYVLPASVPPVSVLPCTAQVEGELAGLEEAPLLYLAQPLVVALVNGSRPATVRGAAACFLCTWCCVPTVTMSYHTVTREHQTMTCGFVMSCSKLPVCLVHTCHDGVDTVELTLE